MYKNIFYEIDHLNEGREQWNETEKPSDDEDRIFGNNRSTKRLLPH